MKNIDIGRNNKASKSTWAFGLPVNQQNSMLALLY